jgi:DNA segregation ATPase FtsK/SpoIIIE-like protein
MKETLELETPARAATPAPTAGRDPGCIAPDGMDPVKACHRDRLREQMERLRREAKARSCEEEDIVFQHVSTLAAEKTRTDKAEAEVRVRYDRDLERAKTEYASQVAQVEEKLASERTRIRAEVERTKADIKRSFEERSAKVGEDFEAEEIPHREVYKERLAEAARRCTRREQQITKALEQCDAIGKRAANLLALRGIPMTSEADGTETVDANLPAGQTPDAAAGAPGAEARTGSVERPTRPPTADPFPALEEHVKAASARLSDLDRLPGAAIFTPSAIVAAILVPFIIAAAAGGGLAVLVLSGGVPGLEGTAMAGAAGAAAGAVLAALGAGIGLWIVGSRRTKARTASREIHERLRASLTQARALDQPARSFVSHQRRHLLKRIEETYASETAARRQAIEARHTNRQSRRDRDLEQSAARAAAEEETIEGKAASALAALERKYPPRIEGLTKSRAEDLARIEQEHRAALEAIESRRMTRWTAMTTAWKAAREETAAVWALADRLDREAFHSWEALADESIPLPSQSPPWLRFGEMALTLRRIPGGISKHDALNHFGPEAWTQPATMPFPDESSLLIKTTTNEAERASDMIQALMLRIATGIPAGQSRFTIIDPLGLGKQFAGFMHLADHDELLVTSRIWTEPPQIEQRLADITEQMELVIQKYLRNEYESIGHYNADAEVPEPYRFVVVANFPANFTETSARRLASIAASGARCGVYTIVSVDKKATMPPNFSLAELEKLSTTILLENGRFTWQDPEFEKWPLTVESSPGDELFTRIIQRVGRTAKASKRVEVPFERVAPPEADWWKGDTSKEIDVPLGPAGAKKMQHMRLGRGTSQHVLIAGKTGSGKSTMMHALITNLALTYSPNQIQFYLIDFKKGVEFKVYDHYELPHARVIAIESEREFGLSVLEQLDRELKRRGDLFRDLAVQDLAGFRATGHPDPMPRVLLIIDEFQELFVEDDKLAQEASLVLDRLVRQGRAFGMHVLLGSQTLGGSYSLPRSTMGQMAVRVALQCNEADSSLILSEENSAARLLTRPGEAIYNDANGMLAGNNPFQVVWLGDERRERYLGSLKRFADNHPEIPKLPRIVFDGNEAADPRGNPLLAELIGSGTVHGSEPTVPTAWLGDAIAIKDPTAAPFRRQGGANLLVVGQREDLGVSLLAMGIVSLAAGQDAHPGGTFGRPARFVLLEPAVAEERPETMLSRLAERLPHRFETVARLGVASALESLAAEVRRRIDEQVADGEAVYLVIRDLGRFRELRKADGDFGFSFGSDQKAGPSQDLVAILKDGPTVGVHALLWCDSLTNLMRTFERGTLKEFELRALFQMSQNDSSQLIDSPAAGKLGPQRALFIHEETGTLEKFRPYAFPSDEWLTEVAHRLAGRNQGTPSDRPPAAARPAAADPITPSFDFASMLDKPLPPETGEASS